MLEAQLYFISTEQSTRAQRTTDNPSCLFHSTLGASSHTDTRSRLTLLRRRCLNTSHPSRGDSNTSDEATTPGSPFMRKPHLPHAVLIRSPRNCNSQRSCRSSVRTIIISQTPDSAALARTTPTPQEVGHSSFSTCFSIERPRFSEDVGFSALQIIKHLIHIAPI